MRTIQCSSDRKPEKLFAKFSIDSSSRHLLMVRMINTFFNTEKSETWICNWPYDNDWWHGPGKFLACYQWIQYRFQIFLKSFYTNCRFWSIYKLCWMVWNISDFYISDLTTNHYLVERRSLEYPRSLLECLSWQFHIPRSCQPYNKSPKPVQLKESAYMSSVVVYSIGIASKTLLVSIPKRRPQKSDLTTMGSSFLSSQKSEDISLNFFIPP